MILILKWAFLIPVVHLSIIEDYSKQKLRVYKGVSDTADLYPYVISIEKPVNLIRICTGSVIHKNWVLTAAHCMRNNDVPLIVSYGNRSSNQTVKRVKTLEHVPHPEYMRSNNNQSNSLIIINDIGLMRVPTIILRKYGTLAKTDYRKLFNLPVTYAGFGHTWVDFNDEKKENENKERGWIRSPVQLGKGTLTQCSPDIHFYPIECTVSGGEQKLFLGDQGGPLIYENTIIGLYVGKYQNQMLFNAATLYRVWVCSVLKTKLMSRVMVVNLAANVNLRMDEDMEQPDVSNNDNNDDNLLSRWIQIDPGNVK